LSEHPARRNLAGTEGELRKMIAKFNINNEELGFATP